MCGLFGMIGPGIQTADLNFMRDLAYVSGLRGTDGTGIFQAAVYKKSQKYILEKGVSEVSYFLWFHENDEKGNVNILGDINDNIVMGHVRAATKGDVNDKNAHPFDVGKIVGAHNGTLRDKKYESKTKTDSEMLFEDIAKRGPVEVLKELDKDSAYAITMYDKSTGTMKFFKNEKRSLFYTFNTKRKVMYWASEKNMLDFVATRCGIDYGIIYRFTDNMIYSLNPFDVNVNKAPDWKVIALPIPPKVVERFPLITRVTPERENLTTMLLEGPKSTVLPLNLNLRKKGATRHPLVTTCVYCKNIMDPLAQYHGTELSPNVYSCKPCEDVNEMMLKEHMERHSPIKGIM